MSVRRSGCPSDVILREENEFLIFFFRPPLTLADIQGPFVYRPLAKISKEGHTSKEVLHFQERICGKFECDLVTAANDPRCKTCDKIFHKKCLRIQKRPGADFTCGYCTGGWISTWLFLDAPSHLYSRLCPSVRRSVRPSVGPPVRPSVPCYFQTRTRRILCRVSGLV